MVQLWFDTHKAVTYLSMVDIEYFLFLFVTMFKHVFNFKSSVL